MQELLAQITWYRHIALLDKVRDAKEWVRVGDEGLGGALMLPACPWSPW
ncbi:MAG: hypothetical protein ABFC78_03560 [Methanoregula sp.]